MSINAIVNYIPSGQAVLVRSYYKQLGFNWQPAMTVLASPNPLIVAENVYNNYVTHIKLKDEWWYWNSNVYSLDFIFEDFYVIDLSTGLQVPGVHLDIAQGRDAQGVPGIAAAWAGSSGDAIRVTFPASPADYWLPLP